MGNVIEVGGIAMVVRRPGTDGLTVCGRHWVTVSAIVEAIGDVCSRAFYDDR